MSTTKSIFRVFSFLLVLMLTISALGVTPAHAAGIRYATPTGTGDCSTWANACTLQTALTGATSGDEIWASAGTYKPTTNVTDRDATFQLNSALYGGFAGTETTRDQRDPATNVTILSGDIDNNDSQKPIITDLTTVTGNTSNSYHVVTGATGATLDGFTITAGNANGADEYSNGSGGGMFNAGGGPNLLTGVTFIGNSAASNGGGMYSSTFADSALANVTFSGNSAGLFGGGMYNWDNSPTLTDVTFNANKATHGGGMYNVYSNPTLTNVTLSFNSTTGGNGGGMYDDHSDSSLTDVTFSDNSTASGAGGLGGGMYNIYSNPTLTNVTFSDNSAGYGGGMYNIYSSPPLTNVTFKANSAVGGGGMLNDTSNPMLTNVTLEANSAWFGGGIANTGSNLQIRNTIFWANSALAIDPPGTAQISNSSSTSFLSYSVVQGGCPPGSVCTNIITANPLLGILGNYGGFTQTIPLLSGSSAIDTGNDATCAATDQRGVIRPQGVHCDIGAFELEVHTLTITSAHGTVTANPDQAIYHEGDVVQLTATPNAGWSFANWTGDLTSNVNPDSVTIHGDTSVTANYTQNVYTLFLPLTLR